VDKGKLIKILPIKDLHTTISIVFENKINYKLRRIEEENEEMNHQAGSVEDN